jgi:glycine cleavage system regulatory protein
MVGNSMGEGAVMATISLILTVLGDDRPGLVESLAQLIAAHDGNWLESRMARLAGKFAGILRATVPAANAAVLQQALHELSTQGLTVVVESSADDVATPPYRGFKLAVLGMDRPGIVRDIAHVLAEHGVNIAGFESTYSSAPMSGETLFRASAQLQVPGVVMIAALQATLEQLAHDLMVDITLEDMPAHPEPPQVLFRR